ncbi:ABC transporter substrate-binding protein [Planctomonas psychrotolerans]|uniref:ABC transporter substrate-binding protein n=1 Tax=Planctomonas psychrotolerans TaxID=2528712 RepID=UPI001D0D3C17|nr:extracellular solute-binding protein [Planctomonas psychrotolerans]
MTKLLRLTTIGLTAVLALSVVGCTGGAPSDGGGNDTDPDTLRFMIGQPEDPADLALTEQDIATFAEESGITIELDVIPSENVRTVLQTQLRSGDGPDIFGYDTGPGFAGALAEAGLLYPLTEHFSEREWPIYDFAQERVTFGGEIVGIPNDIETVGLFYNATMFDELGIAQPQSVADLTAAAQTIADSGVIPFAVSDQEGWQGGHLLSMVLSSEVGSDAMEALIAGDTRWDSPEVVSALTLLADFNEAGYFTPSPAAVTYDNANALFYSGQAAINPTGSWLAQDIERNVEFEVGYMPFPASDGPGIFSGGLGSGLFVNATTTKTDAAVEFIDYLLTQEHGRWSVENTQSIPAFPIDTEGIEATPLFSQILDDAAKIADGSGDFGYNIDVLMSNTFNEAMGNGIQGILTGQATPEEVAVTLQENY